MIPVSKIQLEKGSNPFNSAEIDEALRNTKDLGDVKAGDVQVVRYEGYDVLLNRHVYVSAIKSNDGMFSILRMFVILGRSGKNVVYFSSDVLVKGVTEGNVQFICDLG